MAQSELEKTLSRMKVTLKATELAGTPARGFSSSVRNWHVTLSREIKGEEKPLRLTLNILSAGEPTMDSIIQCLIEDIEASTLTLWEFAQDYNRGKTDTATERMYTTCKRASARAQKFFGDSKVIRNILGIAKAA